MVMNTEKKYYKYPKTPHLPYSDGIHEKSLVMDNIDNFKNKEVIVTEKMDGENTNFYKDHIHARSIDSGYHPSRTWVQNLHSKIRFNIGDNQRICGENLFWVKSIIYTDLPSYFLVFNIWEDDVCYSWDKTLEVTKRLELETVPVLYRGIYDEEKIKSLYDDSMYDKMEGYVVRLANSFKLKDFQQSVGKFVRKNHVKTDDNWIRTGGELNMLRVPKNKTKNEK